MTPAQTTTTTAQETIGLDMTSIHITATSDWDSLTEIDSQAMSQTPNPAGPLYWAALQDTTQSHLLPWMEQRWHLVSGKKWKAPVGGGMAMSYGGKKMEWANWGVSLALFAASKAAIDTLTPLSLPYFVSILSVPICLGTRPALQGSLDVFKKSRQAGASPLVAFGTMIRRSSHVFNSRIPLNPANIPLTFSFWGYQSLLKLQEGLSAMKADKMAQSLDPLIASSGNQIVRFVDKQQNFKKWRAGQLLKATLFDDVTNHTFDTLYFDWASVLFKHRWDKVQYDFNAHLIQEEQRRLADFEAAMSAGKTQGQPISLDDFQDYMGDVDEMLERIKKQKPFFEHHQGLHPHEMALRDAFEDQLASLSPFAGDYSLLFERTESSGMNPWHRPAPGLPSVLELIELIHASSPDLAPYQDRIGRLRSLQEAQDIQSYIGPLTPATDAKPRASTRL